MNGTWPLLLHFTQTFAVPVEAPDMVEAYARARTAWHHRRCSLLSCLSSDIIIDSDDVALCREPEVTSELRAQYGKAALKAHRRHAFAAPDTDAIAELLDDLGFFADSTGVDYATLLASATHRWRERLAFSTLPEGEPL